MCCNNLCSYEKYGKFSLDYPGHPFLSTALTMEYYEFCRLVIAGDHERKVENIWPPMLLLCIHCYLLLLTQKILFYIQHIQHENTFALSKLEYVFTQIRKCPWPPSNSIRPPSRRRVLKTLLQGIGAAFADTILNTWKVCCACALYM